MRSESLDQFLNQAGRIPLLTPSEEIHLGRAVQAMMALREEKPNGPYSREENRVIARGMRARDRMITANLRLVAVLCRKFSRTLVSLGVDDADLMSDGILGLMRGVEKFDPERGYKLSTYIYWWIRQGINRGLVQNARTIRMPTTLAEKLVTHNRIVHGLRQKLGRQPSYAEVAEAMNISEDEYRRFLVMGLRPTSLDMTPTEDGSSLGDLLSDDVSSSEQLDQLSDSLDNDRVRDAINTILSDTERLVVMLRYGFSGEPPKDWKQIGKQLKASRETARTHHAKALRKIQLHLAKTQQVEQPMYRPWTLAAA